MRPETTPAGRPILDAPTLFGLRPFPGKIQPRMVLVDIGGNTDPELAELVADYDATPKHLNQSPWIYDEARGWIVTRKS